MTTHSTVYIPATPLADGTGCVLRLIFERAGHGRRCRSGACFDSPLWYYAHQSALRALATLPPGGPRRALRQRRCRRTALYLANPTPALSNVSGAVLGIALGLMMAEDVLAQRQLAASGNLRCTVDDGIMGLEADGSLERKLAALQDLGMRPAPLPFIVPARTCDGVDTAERHAECIQTLLDLNIFVYPVATLPEAVATCMGLYRSGANPRSAGWRN